MRISAFYRKGDYMAEEMKKDRFDLPRTIVTQDAEVDDQNSLRHLLYYTNELDLIGIVQTSSIFHWIGIKGAVTPEPPKDDGDFHIEIAPYDKEYRWTGTDWMWEEVDEYAAVYENLKRQDPRFLSPDYLRSIIKIGNIGYPGEMEKSTEGSDLIKNAILDDDPRTLYIQAWGGTNTIARALKDIEEECAGKAGWDDLHKTISKKVVITACGEQDKTYRSYIAESWPDIQFVKCLQMGSYAYAWFRMPEGPSKDSLRADFMKQNIVCGKGKLLDGYCVWLDGKYYEGEPSENQFGANENIGNEWFGAKFGLGNPNPYEFLSEGDSPTFFVLLDFGFRTLENFAYGGISGRYVKVDQKNSKGEPLNYWDTTTEDYVSPDGSVANVESMYRYTVDIQNDFAARADWGVAAEGEKVDKAPTLTIKEGNDITAAPGETVTLHAVAEDENENIPSVSWRVYTYASSCEKAAEAALCGAGSDTVTIVIPADAKAGETIHLIAQAKGHGTHTLVHYSQVIITVK